MGAAVGKDAHNAVGYAMLLGTGNASYAPTYTYHWTDATADGAGTHTYTVPKPASALLALHLGISGSNLVVHIGPPAGTNLRCSFVRKQGTSFPAPRFKSCTTTPKFPVSPGKYQLTVTSSTGWAQEIVTIT